MHTNHMDMLFDMNQLSPSLVYKMKHTFFTYLIFWGSEGLLRPITVTKTHYLLLLSSVCAEKKEAARFRAY